MESIINKAISGGYFVKDDAFPFALKNGMQKIVDGVITTSRTKNDWDVQSRTFLKNLNVDKIILDPDFWQALGKVSGWNKHIGYVGKDKNWWLEKALSFHEINLTEGWDKAVAYLQELVK